MAATIELILFSRLSNESIDTLPLRLRSLHQHMVVECARVEGVALAVALIRMRRELAELSPAGAVRVPEHQGRSPGDISHRERRMDHFLQGVP